MTLLKRLLLILFITESFSQLILFLFATLTKCANQAWFLAESTNKSKLYINHLYKLIKESENYSFFHSEETENHV